jgi:nicotinamidase-related amidase
MLLPDEHGIVAVMTTALVVIDVQNEYVTGGLPIVHPPVADSLAHITAAIDAANAAGLPVILVRHEETDTDSTIFVRDSAGWQIHDSVASRPYDVIVDKAVPGSFTNTNLEALLRDRSVDAITVVGYMTHMCVDTTTRQANHLGLDVTVLSDATGTIDVSDDLPAALVHRVELGVLGDGFATVATTNEWLETLSSR